MSGVCGLIAQGEEREGEEPSYLLLAIGYDVVLPVGGDVVS